MKIEQVYHHFSKWEDYKHGFYIGSSDLYQEHISKSIDLLSNQDLFYSYGKKMINEWVYSCEQNLTDPSINKIAYIGQASCCIANGTPSFITRNAWWFVDDLDKDRANKTAKILLEEWKQNYIIKGSLWEKLDLI